MTEDNHHLEPHRYGGPRCWIDRRDPLRTSYWSTPEAARGIVLPWTESQTGELLLLVPATTPAAVREALETATHGRLHTHMDVWCTGLTLLVHTPARSMMHRVPSYHAMSAAMWRHDHGPVMQCIVWAQHDGETATRLATWPVYCSCDRAREMTPEEHKAWIRKLMAPPDHSRRRGVAMSAIPWARELTPEWRELPLPRWPSRAPRQR